MLLVEKSGGFPPQKTTDPRGAMFQQKSLFEIGLLGGSDAVVGLCSCPMGRARHRTVDVLIGASSRLGIVHAKSTC